MVDVDAAAVSLAVRDGNDGVAVWDGGRDGDVECELDVVSVRVADGDNDDDFDVVGAAVGVFVRDGVTLSVRVGVRDRVPLVVNDGVNDGVLVDDGDTDGVPEVDAVSDVDAVAVTITAVTACASRANATSWSAVGPRI